MIFEVVNCLLQQQIYYYIKIVIKIFKFIATEFFVLQTYYLKFY